MAQRTLSSGSHIRPHRSLYGHFPIRMMPESTGQSFLAGWPVNFEAGQSTDTHRIEEASSLSTNVLGIAAAPASSVVDTQIPVYLAHEGVEFRGAYKGVALASSHLGTRRALAKDTTLNIYYVDNNSSVSDHQIVITDVTIPGNDIGDTNAEVGFMFIPERAAFSAMPSSNIR